MRSMICAVLGAMLLSACGQSGNLQLTSDPNYDHRAKYLVYPNPLQKAVTPKTETTTPPAVSQDTP